MSAVINLELAFLTLGLSLTAVHAQGSGTMGNAGSGSGGWSGAGGGAAIARVAVAPGAVGGGATGFGGGQTAFGGGGQGFGGGGGGGGLHGVTRRTFMAEPNVMAAQFFTSGGVNVVPATGLGMATGGAGYYGAGVRASSHTGRIAARDGKGFETRSALAGAQDAQRRPAWGGLPGPGRQIGRAAPAVEAPRAEPALSAAQMAGVTPAQ